MYLALKCALPVATAVGSRFSQARWWEVDGYRAGKLQGHLVGFGKPLLAPVSTQSSSDIAVEVRGKVTESGDRSHYLRIGLSQANSEGTK